MAERQGGQATTQMLSKKGASEIIAVSRNPEKIGDIPKNVKLEKLDVLDEQGLKFFRENASFDVLINRANGGTRAAGPFLQMDT